MMKLGHQFHCEYSWVCCSHFQCNEHCQSTLVHLCCHRRNWSMKWHLGSNGIISNHTRVYHKTRGFVPRVVNPSCLHTTSASWLLQPESQILPQVRFTHTWTVPFLNPDKRRTLPSVQLSGTKGARCVWQKNLSTVNQHSWCLIVC